MRPEDIQSQLSEEVDIIAVVMCRGKFIRSRRPGVSSSSSSRPGVAREGFSAAAAGKGTATQPIEVELYDDLDDSVFMELEISQPDPEEVKEAEEEDRKQESDEAMADDLPDLEFPRFGAERRRRSDIPDPRSRSTPPIEVVVLDADSLDV